MISYSEDCKIAYFDGLRFCQDDRTGYYLNAITHKRLHRYVYEKAHGPIPKGYDIHHIDHDKRNNEIENLEMLTSFEHKRRHGEELTEDEREKRRENMNKAARPAAIAWHKSEAGKGWHKEHYKDTAQSMHERTSKTCKQCGKVFLGTASPRNVFCSNACKSAWRRKVGLDNEQRKCAMCGAEFTANRYKETACCSKECASRLRSKNRQDKKAALSACV